MEYNHSRKAGNRGDVWKHSVLVALVDAIPISGNAFRWIECHAGAPEHLLKPGGEWERGIGDALRQAKPQSPYYERAAEFVGEGRYPAGWVFAAERLAKRCNQVEIRLFDTSDDVARQYRRKLKLVPPNVNWRFTKADGIGYVRRVSSADLVFLDPPFHPDANVDWSRLTECCRDLVVAGVPFVAWYPFYWPTKPQQLVDATGCDAWEVAWTACGRKPSQNLKGCGMLVSAQLAALLPGIEKQLVWVAQSLVSDLIVRSPSHFLVSQM